MSDQCLQLPKEGPSARDEPIHPIRYERRSIDELVVTPRRLLGLSAEKRNERCKVDWLECDKSLRHELVAKLLGIDSDDGESA